MLSSKSSKCSHGEVEFLGEQSGDKGVNRYYKCRKCGAVLVLSEDGVLYEVTAESVGKLQRESQ